MRREITRVKMGYKVAYNHIEGHFNKIKSKMSPTDQKNFADALHDLNWVIQRYDEERDAIRGLKDMVSYAMTNRIQGQ